ncbi:MAG: glycosyl transferase [Linnemannia gamsii]|nr:MAG: glycosyl transferase [Linnemannia gamsii]
MGQAHSTTDNDKVPQSDVPRIPHTDLPRIPQSVGPRIFDTVLLNDELEWLEIRMNELDKVVDVFVVIESEQTFQRGYKPLYFQQASRDKTFARFMDRVLHIVVPNITEAEEARNLKIGGDGPWAIEAYLRNKGVQMALQTFQPSPGDWVLHSDVDEIPRASALAKIKASSSSPEDENNPLLQTRVLDCNFFYYSFEFKHAESRKGPVLAQFQLAPAGVDPNSDEPIELDYRDTRVLNKPLWEDWPNVGIRLRGHSYKDNGPNLVEDACWHCSWCFSNISYVYSKAASYAHAEHNAAVYMNNTWIIKHFRQGKDLFDRNEIYNYGGKPINVPKFIVDHPDRFAYLTNRYKVPNAGFLDVPENSVHF